MIRAPFAGCLNASTFGVVVRHRLQLKNTEDVTNLLAFLYLFSILTKRWWNPPTACRRQWTIRILAKASGFSIALWKTATPASDGNSHWRIGEFHLVQPQEDPEWCSISQFLTDHMVSYNSIA